LIAPAGQSVTQTAVAVEKGANTVILATFGVFVERKINELQIKFVTRRSSEEFFNRHSPLCYAPNGHWTKRNITHLQAGRGIGFCHSYTDAHDVARSHSVQIFA
jgi:hypothetical protein